MKEQSPAGKPFGNYQGRAVISYSICNKHGMEAHILNLGGILSKLLVPGRDGKLRNVVFGFDHFSNYVPNLDHHIGSLVGRYANRIGGAAFSINGQRFQLAANEGKNILHGGNNNLSGRFWNATAIDDHLLRLQIESPDGDEGFPGKLDVQVTIAVTDNNELSLQYEAISSRPTHVCFTQHAYFNLSGSPSNVLNHDVWVDAACITETDNQHIPTGNYISVKGTAYNLTKPIAIKDIIQKIPEGLDDNFVLRNDDDASFKTRKVAGLYDPDSGILMEVHTSEPGLQVYTANHLHKIISPFAIPLFPAICLEAQHFPDSPNKPQFPSTLLLPDQIYRQNTRYGFSIKKQKD